MKKDTQEAAFRQRVMEYQEKDYAVIETAIRYFFLDGLPTTAGVKPTKNKLLHKGGAWR